MKSPNDLIKKLTDDFRAAKTHRNWYEKTSYEEEVIYSH